MSKDRDRFWLKVEIIDDEDSCWNWRGSIGSHGYGQFSLNSRPQLAHRVSFEWANGPIIKGMDICHKCDNPQCVRPSHLFEGTRQTNVRDMIAKNRHCYGERSKQVKITDEQCLLMIELYMRGTHTQEQLAQLFGVSQPHVGDVVRRTKRKHLEGEVLHVTSR